MCLAAVVGKLIYVQVIASERYSETARKHLEKRRALQAQRGTIVDRTGEVVAADIINYAIAVKTDDVENRRETAAKLAKALNRNKDEVYKAISGTDRFVYLERRISEAKAAPVQALKLPGVIVERGFSRYYRYDASAAHVIGYVDYDNKGQGGLELEYEKYLAGVPGWKMMLRDARGNYRIDFDAQSKNPRNGYQLETTLDMVYQGIVEDELVAAVKKFNAESGSVVLLDPRDGAILSMANYPTYNPNKYVDYSLSDYRNRAITDPNEPGSTFKMVALAMCIENLHLNLDGEPVFCGNGRLTLFDKTIKDHKPFGWLTPRKVFENSSNIGVIKLAEQFNPRTFYKYARDFGFGNQTTIDLPAETNGVLRRPNEFHGASVAYMSMGYEVMVTPLQLACAYAAIANGGILMQPRVVNRIVDEKGNVVKAFPPLEIRRVVSGATARRMQEVLTGVVEHGTGANAAVAGITIAGKTGTAQKIDRTTNSYSDEQHAASFAGFFPVESPRFVMLVTINRPKGEYYGGTVAAPVFQKIAHRISGLPRDQYIAEGPREMASIKKEGDGNFLKLLDFDKIFDAWGAVEEDPQELDDIVTRPGGASITRVAPTPRGKSVVDLQEMPDVVGMTLREALQVVAARGIRYELSGSGVVKEQKPAPGEILSPGSVLKLICKVY